MKEWIVYIATNKKYGVLYVGKTGNMLIRGFQHATGNGSLFTKSIIVTRSYILSYTKLSTKRQKEKSN
jgi:predicted GIY-YIG superfamily endonuclease